MVSEGLKKVESSSVEQDTHLEGGVCAHTEHWLGEVCFSRIVIGSFDIHPSTAPYHHLQRLRKD